MIHNRFVAGQEFLEKRNSIRQYGFAPLRSIEPFRTVLNLDDDPPPYAADLQGING